ncbi:MAG: hypothetical protein OHK005_09160 [Candidatus Methylacidiphilales bacterium]
MNSGRDTILQRVREALRHPAPFPGSHHCGQSHAPETPADFRPWLPPVGPHPADWLRAFRENFAALQGRFLHASDHESLTVQLRDLASEQNWKKIASLPDSPEIDLARTLGPEVMEVRRGYSVEEMETCDAAITGCDLLIAQTGSILVTSRSSGGRALTVFPPHHVVLANPTKLVPDLPEAFTYIERVYGTSPPSMIGFITGASRTGDIERILVLGAHGPRQLTVAFVGAVE